MKKYTREVIEKRNSQVLDYYLKHLNLRMTGEEFGISRERVRQILRKMGADQVANKIRKANRDKKRQAILLRKANKPKCCRDCGVSFTKTFINHGYGRCDSCYRKHRYKTNPDVKEYYRKKTSEWKHRNLEKWKGINKKAVEKYAMKNKERLRLSQRIWLREKSIKTFNEHGIGYPGLIVRRRRGEMMIFWMNTLLQVQITYDTPNDKTQ